MSIKEYVVILLSLAVTLVCEASEEKQTRTQLNDVSDLELFNCYDPIVTGSCATGCALNECYQTTSLNAATFPQSGFCSVFNTSRPISSNIDWYTVSGRICLSAVSYPQGTGILFNYQGQSEYEVVYKTSQDSSLCYVGYVQNGVLQQTGSFACDTTTADQWHRYTVTVYSNKTFEASLSTQAGNSATSGILNTNYPMSTRGGVLIVNDGTKAKLLSFDEITLRLSTDDCVSSPCQNGGVCNELVGGYTCTCVPGYTGINCETEINECTSSPCQNGGNCNDLINGYTCTCDPGYTGTNCATDINECASYPCENGGSCYNLAGGYDCSCLPGFTGNRCETGVRCPSGYELYESSCYRFGNELLQWSDARSRCLADGADLVTIETQAEDDFLTTKITNCNTYGAWIGLTDSATEGDWRWVATGNTPLYTDWSAGQPDDSGGEDCGHKWSSANWMWNDAPCTPTFLVSCYICEL